jgi:nucleotide-binding universal stress UspA family protein
MVATDGSESADRAVDVAAELAKALGGNLLIVTIGGSLSGEEIRQIERANENVGDVLDALSTSTLMAARERASRKGLSAIEVHSGWGDPAETIIEIARRDRIDAVVLGRRGRGRLAGLLLGSVSQKIASLAPCAVIVVP